MTKPIAGKRILVTNDDGIHAPGLTVLKSIADQLSDDVWIVAPEVEQSGAGHSLSLHAPLRYQKWEERRYSVRGTPTDCVLFAITSLLENKVDLVLSGVNRGMNAAEDVTHSGTIAAAMEGTLCGVPSIALSLQYAMADLEPEVRWKLPTERGAEVVEKLWQAGIPNGVLMNVNFPDVADGQCKGIKLTATGKRHCGKQLDTRNDKHGRPYYWIHWGGDDEAVLTADTDLAEIANGYITVTPINLDLTDYRVLQQLRERAIF